ncbi:MAG: addiction module protein [Desulfonatronovibrio sp.]|nr:addiction module protein [Desulfovibrionales bacterium]
MESVVLEKEAMKLSMLERALLADRLLQTLEVDHEESLNAWTKVANHRLKKFQSGEMDTLDNKELVESLKRKDG